MKDGIFYLAMQINHGGRFNEMPQGKQSEMAVARLNIDVFDGKDLSNNQCFKHDFSAHSFMPGVIQESNSTFETYF